MPQTECIRLDVAVDRSVGEPLRAVWIAVEDVVHAVDQHLFRPVVAVHHDKRRGYHDVSTSGVTVSSARATRRASVDKQLILAVKLGYRICGLGSPRGVISNDILPRTN